MLPRTRNTNSPSCIPNSGQSDSCMCQRKSDVYVPYEYSFTNTRNPFFYFWLCWVFLAAHGLSLVVESRGCSLVVVRGLLIAVASLVAEHGLQACRLQKLQQEASGVVMHGPSCFTACGIFLDRGSNLCPLHRQAVSYHCTTTEVQHKELLREKLQFFEVTFQITAFSESESCSVVSSSLQPYSPTIQSMDYIVHGLLQARILEWVAIPFSRGSSQPRD